MAIFTAANTQRLGSRSDIMSNGPEVRFGYIVFGGNELASIIETVEFAVADVNGSAFD
ncbi:hypothetical protein ES703_65274 [subsurface metagenome]